MATSMLRSRLLPSVAPNLALVAALSSRRDVTDLQQQQQRHSSSNSRYRKPGSQLGQTSVFVQSGLKIQELPLIVKKVNDVLKISGMDKFRDVIDPSSRGRRPLLQQPPPEPIDPDTAEMIAGFNRCISVQGIFRLLETIPAEEVTPSIAVHALKKIIELENNLNLRNPAIYKSPNSSSNKLPAEIASINARNSNETFLRIAFINMLLDIVYRCRDPRIILEGLQIVSRDTFPGDQSSYKERMCEEMLVCISEGIFSLRQICEAVVILSTFYSEKKKCYDLTDKLWSGILEKADEIDANTISCVCATLPHLKTSRDIVQSIVEEKASEFWQEYSIGNVLEILKVYTELNCGSDKVLKVISQWLKVNIHSLNESETLAIIYCFHILGYVDDTIIKTMEKYLKIRGCQIKETDLVATICDYCLTYRIRSKQILAGVGEYFIEHGRNLSTPQIYSLSRIFGELDMHPPNGFKFWEIVEYVLEHKFVEFPPKEVIDLLLSFIYIERYPLNFVRKIFNPFFMDRLHNQQDADVLHSRTQLKLFDNAMKMESRNYNGPYLPKETNYRTIPFDHQVSRLANHLVEPLGDIVGDASRIGRSVVLSSLPLHPLYVADLMIYPSVAASLLRFGSNTNNSQNIVVVLHPAEHYIRGSHSLVGPQVMRVRQFKSMGFRLLEFNVEELMRMRVNPKKLRQFIADKYYKLLSEG